MPDLWDVSSFKMQNSCQINPYWMTMEKAGAVGCQRILGEDGIWAEWFYSHTWWNRNEVKLHSSLRDQEGVPPLAHSLLQSCTIGWVHCCGFPHYPDAAHVEVGWQENTRLSTELSWPKRTNPVFQPPTHCGPAHASLLHNNHINLPLPIPAN